MRPVYSINKLGQPIELTEFNSLKEIQNEPTLNLRPRAGCSRHNHLHLRRNWILEEIMNTTITYGTRAIVISPAGVKVILLSITTWDFLTKEMKK